MPNNSPTNNRVINPINTYYVQNYTNATMVMPYLFPSVAHASSGGTTIIMASGAFDLEDDDVLPGERPIPELKIGYEGRPFAKTFTYYNLPLEYAKISDAEQLGIPIEEFAMRSLMDRVALKFEHRRALLATNYNNYATNNRVTLTGTDQLNDPNSPIEEIRDAAHAAGIRAIGKRYNAVFGSFEVIDACCRHPVVKAQYNPTTGGVVNLTQLAAFFKVNRVFEVNASRRSGGTSTFVFGKYLLFAYVDPQVLTRPVDAPMFVPTGSVNLLTENFGATYTTPGHPVGLEAIDVPIERKRVWGIDLECAPVLTGVDRESGLVIAGYLIRDAIA